MTLPILIQSVFVHEDSSLEISLTDGSLLTISKEELQALLQNQAIFVQEEEDDEDEKSE